MLTYSTQSHDQSRDQSRDLHSFPSSLSLHSSPNTSTFIHHQGLQDAITNPSNQSNVQEISELSPDWLMGSWSRHVDSCSPITDANQSTCSSPFSSSSSSTGSCFADVMNPYFGDVINPFYVSLFPGSIGQLSDFLPTTNILQGYPELSSSGIWQDEQKHIWQDNEQHVWQDQEHNVWQGQNKHVWQGQGSLAGEKQSLMTSQVCDDVTSERKPPSYQEHVSRMKREETGEELSRDRLTSYGVTSQDVPDCVTMQDLEKKRNSNHSLQINSKPKLSKLLDFFCSINSGSSHIQLWQFLLELLADPSAHSSSIRWENREVGEFCMLDPDHVAHLWGRRKRRANMNQDKMGRALRYYYEKMILSKIAGKKSTYRFSTAGLLCQGRRTLGSRLLTFH